MTHRPILAAALASSVREIEQQIDPATPPPRVAAAFAKAAGGGKFGKVESLTRQSQLIAYESAIVNGDKHHELAFRPDGAPMKAA